MEYLWRLDLFEAVVDVISEFGEIGVFVSSHSLFVDHNGSLGDWSSSTFFPFLFILFPWSRAEGAGGGGGVGAGGGSVVVYCSFPLALGF